MEACIFTGIQHRDVTRFQKPPFSYIHMSAAKWQVQNLYTESVSEKMHFRWPFLLDTCGQWAKTGKKSLFLSNNGYVWMGPHVDLQQIYTWENYMEDEYRALLHN